MTTDHSHPTLRIGKLGPLGKWANNLYLLVDPASKDSLIIDAPEGADEVIEPATGTNVRGILITHSHPDHTAGLKQLKETIDAPVYCHPAEPWLDRALVDHDLADGLEIAFGELSLNALFTPGHTPGSTCFLVGKHLFSGDTLFPGGPGRTQNHDDLEQELDSIRNKLLTLDPATVVYPGHGDNTTIETSITEHTAFAAREHAADLHGDVLWAEC